MNTSNKNKLSLRTETIMPLTAEEVGGVRGGLTPSVAASSNWCVAASIAAGKSSDGCAQKGAQYAAKGNDLAKKHLGFSL